jgi:pimeloyl-ACP methyl ester carboxylesterase
LTVGAIKEISWLAAHVALYPAGLLTEIHVGEDPRHRIDPLSPLHRGLILGDIQAHGTPIVLVHGLVDNRSAFAVIRRALRRRGYGRVSTVNYSPLTADVPAAAARLGRRIERICADTGYERVHVVGHSLGGLIARYYVQRLGGDHRVDTLVTLGAPHHGTQLARLFPVLVTRQLRPGSRLMSDLATPVTNCRTRFVSVWSDRDEVVVPPHNGELRHPDLNATGVRVHAVGHLSLLVDSRAVQAVVRALAAPTVVEPEWRRSARPTPAGRSLGVADA